MHTLASCGPKIVGSFWEGTGYFSYFGEAPTTLLQSTVNAYSNNDGMFSLCEYGVDEIKWQSMFRFPSLYVCSSHTGYAMLGNVFVYYFKHFTQKISKTAQSPCNSLNFLLHICTSPTLKHLSHLVMPIEAK